MSASYLDKIDKNHVPAHVAIIMDGNGRWAKSQGKERVYGHAEGVVSVRAVTEAAREIGVSYLTLYAFSTENWNRPESEVIGLMDLMVHALEKETPDLIKYGVRLGVIGDMTRLSEHLRSRLMKCISDTKEGKSLTLILALSYSSRWEITEAVKLIGRDLLAGRITEDDINEALVSAHLTTHDIPDPDLLIRTSGELRISNFLMWQLSYSELYFTEVPWPAFRQEAFYEAIYSYQSRERRFGKTSEQVRI